MKKKDLRIKKILKITRVIFWFFIGVFLGLFLFISFSFLLFKQIYNHKVYPGVAINGVDFGGKKEEEILKHFRDKNSLISETKFVFLSDGDTATVSAKEIELGYDENLISTQTISIGRSKNNFSNISLIIQAYINRVNLPASYRYSEEKLMGIISPMIKRIHVDPVDSLFNFQNGRVTVFKPSQDGKTVDMEKLKAKIENKLLIAATSTQPQTLAIVLPIKILKPKVTTEDANDLGIRELVGVGTSLFQHSIPNRIFNVTLASTRLNGILVAPDEVFSFNKALGDISAFTGYQQAYIILNGKTVLGDGGGVCQVSTTLFRAILDAGLPIIERQAHAYRVGYYEQDSPAGIDATVFSPSVDLKFKNDTGNYILIQTFIDPSILKLTFSLYGTRDGRKVILGKPVITKQTPPLPDVHQDDPTLQKGIVKQADFAAWGASVYFTREVIKDNKVVISDKFVSNYRPWAAVYLHGTKE
ncbi:MAG: VanW family protein [Candidatus Levybacteria bacterium]|nr:VanW family protein [Candidatus Levybacteria bacterium]